MSETATPVSFQVGLLGRPNVGKSTLFNMLTRSKKAIVKNQPGVTRDILIEPAEWWGTQFEVVDMGGLTEGDEGFSTLIRGQVLTWIKKMSVIIVIMDGRLGLLPEDREVIRVAKECGRPFMIVVNKIDRFQEADLMTSEFYEFGMDLIPASFENQWGVDQIVEWIIDHKPEGVEAEEQGLRLAFVGKPNVGKSSLMNQLLGDSRMLVTDRPGTTVDAVEVDLDYEGKHYRVVDTAGLRKSARRRAENREGIEGLAAVKSKQMIQRADFVFLMVDGCEGPSVQDARLVELILANHKAVILVANKIDLMEETIDEPRKRFREMVEKEFHFMPKIPICFISAKTGRGIKELFKKVEAMRIQWEIKISTGQLNRFFYETTRQIPAPVWGTRNVKFYYLTQTKQKPPSFIAFANHPQGVTPAYRRFLSKRIQKNWGIEEVPVRIFVMKSK